MKGIRRMEFTPDRTGMTTPEQTAERMIAKYGKEKAVDQANNYALQNAGKSRPSEMYWKKVVAVILHVGRYARSIESGWTGKVIGVEEYSDEVMLKMMGVNDLTMMIAGGSLEQNLEEKDIQWFTVEDVKFIQREPRA